MERHLPTNVETIKLAVLTRSYPTRAYDTRQVAYSRAKCAILCPNNFTEIQDFEKNDRNFTDPLRHTLMSMCYLIKCFLVS